MADIEFLDEPAEIEFVDVAGDVTSPSGAPCSECGTPVESEDHFCPGCGNSNDSAGSAPAATETNQQKLLQCKNCGAEIGTDPNRRSYVCPFCDSTYVVELSRADSGRQPPEFVIGFAVTAEQARSKFRQWIGKNAWFRPGDLKTATLADKQRGVYLPFWSFSMLAQSQWSADIGEYWYRTEMYTTTDANGKTVTRTRTVRETEWWPLNGRHHRYYSGYLVSGSKGLAQTDADRIKPFNLPSLRRYEPHYLAGWDCEEYSVDRQQALQICQREFYNDERHNVADFLPGDTHSQLSVKTQFENVNSDLCLLPVYVLSYRYQKKLYRFLINGQTGAVAGDKPVSWRRIWTLIIVVLVLLLAAYLFTQVF